MSYIHTDELPSSAAAPDMFLENFKKLPVELLLV